MNIMPTRCAHWALKGVCALQLLISTVLFDLRTAEISEVRQESVAPGGMETSATLETKSIGLCVASRSAEAKKDKHSEGMIRGTRK